MRFASTFGKRVQRGSCGFRGGVANDRAGRPAQYTPLFAGEARDLSAAKAHPRDECFQMYYGNVVGVLKEDDDDERASILADLLGGLALPCNAPDAP